MEVINRVRPVDVLAIHELRTLRSGRYTHVDIHLVVPEYYGIARSHDLADTFAKAVVRRPGSKANCTPTWIPASRALCAQCAMQDCPIRREKQVKSARIVLEQAVAGGADLVSFRAHQDDLGPLHEAGFKGSASCHPFRPFSLFFRQFNGGGPSHGFATASLNAGARSRIPYISRAAKKKNGRG